MTPKVKTQPDSSGLIPVVLFIWLLSVTLYGIVWVGAGCYEVFGDIMDAAMKWLLGR